MTGPLISIIVPIYNTEEYIENCVIALRQQTYKNIEVVLVDDGSKDDSGKICDEMADRYDSVVVVHQENKGIYKARLAGVAASNGEYIAFSDSDDYCEKNMYEFLMTNMLEEDADISHCSYEMIRGEVRKKYYGTGKRVVQDRVTGTRDILEGKFIEPTLCTKLFKKGLFGNLEIEGRVDSFEDLLFNVQLFSKAHKAIYEDVVMYHYIKRGGSISTSSSIKKVIDDSKKVMNRIYEVTKDDDEIRKYVESRIVHQWINIYNIALSDAPEYCKMIRKEFPSGVKAISTKRNIMYFSIKHMPHLYKIIKKAL